MGKCPLQNSVPLPLYSLSVSTNYPVLIVLTLALMKSACGAGVRKGREKGKNLFIDHFPRLLWPATQARVICISYILICEFCLEERRYAWLNKPWTSDGTGE